jgi:integral membrane protein
MTKTTFFKIIALLEGISLLTLLFFAYAYRIDFLVRIIGMAHGLLFIGYLIFALILKFEQNWSLTKLAVICLASLLPFGTFYVEKKYLRDA